MLRDMYYVYPDIQKWANHIHGMYKSCSNKGAVLKKMKISLSLSN